MDDGAWRVIEAIILASPGLYAAWISRRAKVVADRAKVVADETSKTLGVVVVNTNGMSQKIETMARAAGVVEGRETERVIGADRAVAVAEAVTAARTEEKK